MRLNILRTFPASSASPLWVVNTSPVSCQSWPARSAARRPGCPAQARSAWTATEGRPRVRRDCSVLVSPCTRTDRQTATCGGTGGRAADRARTRNELLAATEKLLAPLTARVQAGQSQAPGRSASRWARRSAGTRPASTSPSPSPMTSLTVTRRQDQIDAEAALDGFYVLRTPVPASPAGRTPRWWPPTRTSNTSSGTSGSIKADDLDLRPVFFRLEERVRAHVLICMLACYLTWHLRRAWAPLTFTDENPPAPGNPGRPGPPLRSPPGQGLTPARPGRAALPQLPRPAGPPGHLDPQPGPFAGTTSPSRCSPTDQHPAAGLRAHRTRSRSP